MLSISRTIFDGASLHLMEIKEYELSNISIIKNNLRTPLNQNIRNNMKKIFPYYGANGIIDYVNFYKIDFDCILIPEDGSITNSNGKLNIHWIEKSKISVSNHAHVIVNNPEKIILKFLFYCLGKINVKKYISGSVQEKLNLKNLNKIKIVIPNMSVQQKIINIIEPFEYLMNNIIKKYKYLILLGESKSSHQKKEKIKLKEYFYVNIGGTPSTHKKEFWSGKNYWINSSSLTNNLVTKISDIKNISNSALNSKKLKISKIKSTFLSIIEPNINKISLSSFPTTYNQSVANIQAKNPLHNGYIFFELRKKIFNLSKLASGTAQKSINKTDIENTIIEIPENDFIKNKICDLLILLSTQEELIKKIISKLIDFYII